MSERSTDLIADAQRYARGELSGDDLERFEDCLMEHPELVDEIETEQVLRSAFRAEFTGVESTAASGERVVSLPSSRAPMVAYLAAAASIVFAVAVGVNSLRAPAVPAGMAIDAEVRLEAFRSSGVESLPTVSNAAERTLFVVDVGPDASPLHHIVVNRGDGSEFLRIDELTAIDGYLQFTANNMAADIYEVEVYAGQNPEPALRYAFKVSAD